MKSQHQQKLRGRWRLENLQGTAVGSQVFSTYLTFTFWVDVAHRRHQGRPDGPIAFPLKAGMLKESGVRPAYATYITLVHKVKT